MFESGLVSITFRKLSPSEIISLCVEAGLAGIEWGGDAHVPPGDKETARKVGEATRDAGLKVFCYGSYYRLGSDHTPEKDFTAVLDSAEALGAPVIRVWPGVKGSSETSPGERANIAEEAIAITEMANERGIRVAYEFHANTMTDSEASAVELLSNADHPALKSLWQPINKAPTEVSLSALKAVMHRLEHVHIFQWDFSEGQLDRRPLSEGEEIWLTYLDEIKSSGKTCPVLLEFVRDDSTDQLKADAAVLNCWLKALNS